MELTGKRIAILVDQAYQEMEVWYPYFRFQEAGAEAILIGMEKGKIKLSMKAIDQKTGQDIQPAEGQREAS